jgi:restriction endonuclease S subunit
LPKSKPLKPYRRLSPSSFDSPEAQTWERKKLGDICSITTGTTPATNQQHYYQGTIPFIKTSEIINNIINQSEIYISEQALNDYNLKLYPKGTILMAMYGQGKTRGQVAILNIAATTTQNAAAIVPSSDLSSEYLWYWLRGQ